MRHVWALLWKEWRQGWAVMLLLWALAIPVGHLVGGQVRPWAGQAERVMLGVAFLCLCASMVAARLVASEGEEGTIGFVARQPVEPGVVWSTKLLVGVAFLVVLYALWWATGPRFTVRSELVTVTAGDRVLGTCFPQRAALWPLVSFAAAFCLSTVVDNTILALVGGLVAAVAFATALRLGMFLLVSRLAAAGGAPGLVVVPTLAVLMAVVVALLVLSRLAFGVRVRR